MRKYQKEWRFMTIAERIAGLSAAVNIAEPFPARLTRAKSAKGRASGAADHSEPAATETS